MGTRAARPLCIRHCARRRRATWRPNCSVWKDRARGPTPVSRGALASALAVGGRIARSKRARTAGVGAPPGPSARALASRVAGWKYRTRNRAHRRRDGRDRDRGVSGARRTCASFGYARAETRGARAAVDAAPRARLWPAAQDGAARRPPFGQRARLQPRRSRHSGPAGLGARSDGSPLEDVASWLQSLGFWEPAVKRKHDTLLGAYLRARGLPARPSRAIRDVYWLASASNCLAGALGYHLHMAANHASTSRERVAAVHAAGDCMRVIRRADACWRAIRHGHERREAGTSRPADSAGGSSSQRTTHARSPSTTSVMLPLRGRNSSHRAGLTP